MCLGSACFILKESLDMKILLIDPSSSGKDLLNILQQQPEADVVSIALPHSINAALDGVISDPWAENLLLQSEDAGFDLVISGGEGGVSLAEWLAYRLGLPHNDERYIWHRRNKQGMIDIASRANLRTPHSFEVTDDKSSQDVQDFLNSHSFEKYVVKPVGSGGSDHVYFCETSQEVEKALKTEAYS